MKNFISEMQVPQNLLSTKRLRGKVLTDICIEAALGELLRDSVENRGINIEI